MNNTKYNELTTALEACDLSAIETAVNNLNRDPNWGACCGEGNNNTWVCWIGWDDSDDCLTVWVEDGRIVSQQRGNSSLAYDALEVSWAIESEYRAHQDTVARRIEEDAD